MSNPFNIDHIVHTVLKEHQHETVNAPSTVVHADYLKQVKAQLEEPEQIAEYSRSSRPLSLVSFPCLLQDTGYPMEVYMPGEHNNGEANVDWSKLRERWVGWGVEIPGQQDWRRHELSSFDDLSVEAKTLPSVVATKYPLPSRDGNYLGAIIKIYGNAAYKPASTGRFLGILSSSSLPTAEHDDPEVVPAIHVLQILADPSTTIVLAADGQAREALVDYLASAFEPYDQIAGEYLLLLLLSSPSVRQPALPPLGTLSVAFKSKAQSAATRFNQIIQSVVPRVVPLSLTIPLLHGHPFSPSSTDSSSLDAGLLQLAEGTVLVVDEDGMGSGGQLNEKAVNNLKALIDCIKEQRVQYHYPYMEGLKMDCAIRIAVLGQAKSLLPVDIHIPVQGHGEPRTTSPDLDSFRSYLSQFGAATHAAKLVIPDETAQLVQESFVKERKEGAKDPEETLKRRMKVARLLALSYPTARLTGELWKRTVELDNQIASRHASA